jgi:ankyrin repeat protein
MPEPFTPITDALITDAQRGELPAIVTYLESGGDINGRSASGSTLLIEAARVGQGGVVTLLLSEGARVTPTDSTGATALHLAAKNGRPFVVEALIKAHQAQSILVDVRDKLGKTPLFYATKNKHSDIVFRLLGNSAHVFEITENNDILHLAAETGDVPLISGILRYCKQHEIDIDYQNVAGSTPLVCAINAGNLEAVKLLIKAGARRDNLVQVGFAPIHYAARQENPEALKALLANISDKERSALVNTEDRLGGTPVAHAAENNKTAALRVLLLYGANIEKSSNDGLTPLIRAAYKGHQEAFDVLIENNANLTARGHEGLSVLMAAIYSKNPSFLRHVIRQYRRKDISIDKPVAGRVALTVAVNKDALEQVIVLLEEDAKRDYRLPSGKTIIHIATEAGKTEVLKALLTVNIRKDVRHALIEAVDALGWSALVTASSYRQYPAVKLLLEEGARRDYRFENGETLINRIAQAGLTEVLKVLLTANISNEARRDLINTSNDSGESPLMLASRYNRIAVIKLLVKYGANIEKRSDFGLAPLHYAACGQPEATKMLLEAGANPNSLTNRGITPMRFAVRANALACAKLLVQHGALLNDAHYIAMALRQAPAELYPQSDAMFDFLHSQGATLPAAASRFPLRPGTMERLAVLRQQDAPYAAAIASGPAAVRALLATPGLRPLRWRDTRMAKHANNGTYELLLVKARADERLALYEANRRLFIAYFAGKIQDSNPHYKGSKGVRGDEDTLLIICGLDKTHLPQYPHLTKEDIELVKKALLKLVSNAYTVARWRAIQAHMADSGNEEYKIFPGAPEKIAELKARAAAASPREPLFVRQAKRAPGSRPSAAAEATPVKRSKARLATASPREPLFFWQAKRAPGSRPSAAAEGTPAKEAKAMVEAADLVTAEEKPPKAKRKPN